MLAYVSWHRPVEGHDRLVYESALERFHRSLAHRPPSGFHGSAAFRAADLPWLGSSQQHRNDAEGGYEDWYLLDGWAAVGVLEEAAVSHGHVTAHEQIAKQAGVSTGAVYRLREGQPALGEARVSAWVSRPSGHESPALADLLGDGMDHTHAGLWRRCIGLGPAPEYCLLAPEAPAGVSTARLPPGWRVRVSPREVLWNG